MSNLNTYEKNIEVSSKEIDSEHKTKTKLEKYAFASPILATIGIIIAATPLLSIAIPIFFVGAIMFLLVSFSPYIALALEVLAVVFGIKAAKALPKKSSARGVAAAGIYIACVLFLAAIVIPVYFFILAIIAGV